MGLLAPLAEFIIQEHKYKNIQGDVLFAGRQTTYFNEITLAKLLSKYELTNQATTPVEFDTETLAVTENPNGPRLITDRYFMQSIGVPKTSFLDVSAYEGADIVHDLGYPVPEQYFERYDFIYNGGCLDNMFNPGVALTGMSRMLKPGGRIVCMESASSWNHAYVMYSPGWFYDYFVTNGYIDCKVYIASYHNNTELCWGPWDMTYCDFKWDRNGPALEAIHKNHLIVITIAEKGMDSTSDLQPLQKQYRDDPAVNADFDRKEEMVRQSSRPILNTAKTYAQLESKDYPVSVGSLGEELNPGIREPRPTNTALAKLAKTINDTNREVRNTIMRSYINSIEHGIKPVFQFVYDAAVSTAYFIGNIFERVYARAFHEYSRVRSQLGKK